MTTALKWLALFQWLPLAFFSTALALYDVAIARSFVFGGLVQTLPTLYFALHAFRYRGHQQVELIARAFQQGEAGKIVLVACGFAIVMTQLDSLNPLALFAGFTLMTIFQSVAAVMIGRHLSS